MKTYKDFLDEVEAAESPGDLFEVAKRCVLRIGELEEKEARDMSPQTEEIDERKKKLDEITKLIQGWAYITATDVMIRDIVSVVASLHAQLTGTGPFGYRPTADADSLKIRTDAQHGVTITHEDREPPPNRFVLPNRGEVTIPGYSTESISCLVVATKLREAADQIAGITETMERSERIFSSQDLNKLRDAALMILDVALSVRREVP